MDKPVRPRLSLRLLSNAMRARGGVRGIASRARQIIASRGWRGLGYGLRLLFSFGQVKAVPNSDGHDRNDYEYWIKKYDTLTHEARVGYRADYLSWDRRPLISVVMPTYRPNAAWLREAIESVRNQVYENWQLCIADDASDRADIRELLEFYAAQNSKVKVAFRSVNGHISATTNSALELADGEYVALLDHDDLLAEDALYWVAHAINANPSARMIYSDEDKIDTDNVRSSPYFKPDWNRALFYSQNMFSHLGVYERALVQQVGAFRLGYEGSQDYDLALRCLELVDESQIVHVPRVLYHWRVHAESTAHSSSAKPYAVLAGERSLSDHFRRIGVKAGAVFFGPGYRVNYELPADQDDLPTVAILLMESSGGEKRAPLMASIAETQYQNYKVVDVQPDQQSSTSLNSLIRELDTDFVVFLNASVKLVEGGWLRELVSQGMQKRLGVVGSKRLNGRSRIANSGLVLGMGVSGVAGQVHEFWGSSDPGYFGRSALSQEVSAVDFSGMLVDRFNFLEVGGFDARTSLRNFANVDLCLRLHRQGLRTIWTPHAVIHDDSFDEISIPDAVFDEEVAYMKAKWPEELRLDRAYSPNLSLAQFDCSLAWPPRIDHSLRSSVEFAGGMAA